MEQDVTIMEKERRLPNRHIPENLDQFLNTSQVLTLHQIESFGWHIQFVRHPLFQDPVIFIGDVKCFSALPDFSYYAAHERHIITIMLNTLRN